MAGSNFTPPDPHCLRQQREREMRRHLRVVVGAVSVCPLCGNEYVPCQVWHRTCGACKRRRSWGDAARAALANVTGAR